MLEEECVLGRGSRVLGRGLRVVGRGSRVVGRGSSVRKKIESGGKGTVGKRIECAGKRRATLTQSLLVAIYNPA